MGHLPRIMHPFMTECTYCGVEEPLRTPTDGVCLRPTAALPVFTTHPNLCCVHGSSIRVRLGIIVLICWAEAVWQSGCALTFAAGGVHCYQADFMLLSDSCANRRMGPGSQVRCAQQQLKASPSSGIVLGTGMESSAWHFGHAQDGV